jgi:hypothetical protein
VVLALLVVLRARIKSLASETPRNRGQLNAYWVDIEGLENCDASADTVKCTMTP